MKTFSFAISVDAKEDADKKLFAGYCSAEDEKGAQKFAEGFIQDKAPAGTICRLTVFEIPADWIREMATKVMAC